MVARLVVGAAIVRGGRVLAARRTAPAALAGRWELPGGKVEPGESPEGALVREIEEELGVTARVERWLDGVVAIDDRHDLRVALASAEGEPRPTEHGAVRWLTGEELDDVEWLDSDLPFVEQLAAVLDVGGPH